MTRSNWIAAFVIVLFVLPLSMGLLSVAREPLNARLASAPEGNLPPPTSTPTPYPVAAFLPIVLKSFAPTPTARGPDWSAEGDQEGACFGNCVATAGDVNGDGYDDVIVNARYLQRPLPNGEVRQGRVCVFHGSDSDLSTEPDWMAAGSECVDPSYSRRARAAGDVNGDGYADIIVGDPCTRCAYVYRGSAGGLQSGPAWTVCFDASWVGYSLQVSTAGDVNGDGYDDVIVGASGYTEDLHEQGKAFVYYGSAHGLSTQADWSAKGDRRTAHFGSVCCAGDVNGDGYDDVIIGAPFWEEEEGIEENEGRAYVYYGSPGGLRSSPSWIAEGNQTEAHFGVVSGAGDVNADGYDDVIVGCPFYEIDGQERGRVFVYHGSGGGLSAAANWTADGDSRDASFGSPVASAGDVNGDGYMDVIIGQVWTSTRPGPDVGRGWVHLFYGSADGLSGSSAERLQAEQAMDYFGSSVASAGDVNGDGYGDFIVGAPRHDGTYKDAGAAFVYHGSSVW